MMIQKTSKSLTITVLKSFNYENQLSAPFQHIQLNSQNNSIIKKMQR